jgi:phenylacetate-coenzyme A ligase PaaK-like adenylate-forming protein
LLEETVFRIETEKLFEEIALQIFQKQIKENAVYREFVLLQKINVSEIKSIEQIPFLPISFFKTHEVKTGEFDADKIFLSSGTTGQITSKHFVKDISLYEKSFTEGFKHFFSEPTDYTFLALLPSYIEQNHSSLIFMMEQLVSKSTDARSAFFLHSTDALITALNELNRENKKHILIGVTYALLDLIEQHELKIPNTIVMETGGMKGRRKEMIREEVHTLLKSKLGVEKIFSEYGMTELLSQAYSKGDGKFNSPPWMKIFIRNPNDPTEILSDGQSGAINIIDLANIHSCAFIATDDLGKRNADGSFSVAGRMDDSDVRGCNLMVI